MRTLVDQTATNVRRWIEALELANRLGVHVLMGGEGVDDWDLYPQREAILRAADNRASANVSYGKPT